MASPPPGASALINAIGGLGGFLTPNMKQRADTAFRFPTAGPYELAMSTLGGAGLTAVIRLPNGVNGPVGHISS